MTQVKLRSPSGETETRDLEPQFSIPDLHQEVRSISKIKIWAEANYGLTDLSGNGKTPFIRDSAGASATISDGPTLDGRKTWACSSSAYVRYPSATLHSAFIVCRVTSSIVDQDPIWHYPRGDGGGTDEWIGQGMRIRTSGKEIQWFPAGLQEVQFQDEAYEGLDVDDGGASWTFLVGLGDSEVLHNGVYRLLGKDPGNITTAGTNSAIGAFVSGAENAAASRVVTMDLALFIGAEEALTTNEKHTIIAYIQSIFPTVVSDKVAWDYRPVGDFRDLVDVNPVFSEDTPSGNYYPPVVFDDNGTFRAFTKGFNDSRVWTNNDPVTRFTIDVDTPSAVLPNQVGAFGSQIQAHVAHWKTGDIYYVMYIIIGVTEAAIILGQSTDPQANYTAVMSLHPDTVNTALGESYETLLLASLFQDPDTDRWHLWFQASTRLNINAKQDTVYCYTDNTLPDSGWTGFTKVWSNEEMWLPTNDEGVNNDGLRPTRGKQANLHFFRKRQDGIYEGLAVVGHAELPDTDRSKQIYPAISARNDPSSWRIIPQVIIDNGKAGSHNRGSIYDPRVLKVNGIHQPQEYNNEFIVHASGWGNPSTFFPSGVYTLPATNKGILEFQRAT